MAMLADLVELVIGVDTHKDTHTPAVVQAVSGAVVDQVTVPATPAGYQQLLPPWPGRAGGGVEPAQASHPPPRRQVRPLDAIRAAREALGRDQLAQPRAAGQRAALSVRLAARRSAVQAATDAQRQLHALVEAAPDPLRGRLRGLTTPRLVSTCGRLRQQAVWDTETCATAASLRTLVRTWRPDPLGRCGVGPIVAAIVLCAWSHPGRCRTDAAFAMLGGTAPIPASSGQTVRCD